MNKNSIVMVVLIVMALILIVQSFQLNTLKTDVAGGKLSTSSIKSSSQSGGSEEGGSLPPSLDNLPQMVGGC